LRSSTNKSPISLAEIARLVGGTVEGNADVEIFDVAPIERAVSGQISFVANTKYEHHAQTTAASALVLGPNIACPRIPALRHPNPYLTFAHIVDLFYPETRCVPAGIHASAIIDPSAKIDPSVGIGPMVHVGAVTQIGRNSQIMPSVYIDHDVTIGANCLVYPGVRILHGSRIGKNVTLHPGVVVGSDGFGFAPTETGLHKIKQVGWVEIDDDVEIGANTTIDRGALGATRIGRGTKIDNLVQIAHNVEIGRNCLIVSQVGISGSTKLGDGVVLGGQVGLVGHVELGDRVSVGAQSGVSKSIPGGETWLGSPAREIHQAKRIIAATYRLPELWKRIRSLENKLGKDSGE
jgi:UDP-3-O-[3-hydroxymyristoyl] glucosamine N-acyltransferase